MGEKYLKMLQEVLNQPYPLSPQIIELIAGECRIEQVKRKQKNSEIGQTSSSEYFLLDGIIHRYKKVSSQCFS